jgi:hypothetical protein
MFRRITAQFVFVCGMIFIVVPSVRAANAVYIPGYNAGGILDDQEIEVQGSSGRIDVPVPFSTSISPSPLPAGYSVSGATGNDTSVYTLLNSIIPSDGSVILINDPHTGAYLGSIPLSVQVSDIAYTNGQLYGILNSSSSLQIDSVSQSGLVQSIFSQSEASSTAIWRLSGAVNGDSLLASRGQVSPSNVPGYVINPTSLAFSQITLPGTAEVFFYGTVINAAANTVTSIVSAGPQTAATFPGGVSLGTVAQNMQYGSAIESNAVSDEFNYTYSPTMPAAVQITSSFYSGPFTDEVDGLIRTPEVITNSGSVNISNYVAPDGTTLSNVAATNLLIGVGPTPFLITQQPAAPGNLSNRSLGQATATLNLANAQRGIYALSVNPSITATYTYGSTVDTSRAVTSNPTGTPTFAYDPISSNLVGNGDATLGGAGWESMNDGSSFISQFAQADAAHKSFVLPTLTPYPAAIRQYLQLPTSSGAMALSFTYFLQDFPDSMPDNIQVTLNGTQIAEVTASSTTAQTFETVIDDPTLENQQNADLEFQATATGPEGDYVDIGNISLTSLPEPASGTLLFFLACALGRRSRISPPGSTKDDVNS